MARQRAKWLWSDIMVGFKEVGYDPTSNEKQRILECYSLRNLKCYLKRRYENGKRRTRLI
jgi:hypothetical protein